jgi:hypothetical protein
MNTPPTHKAPPICVKFAAMLLATEIGLAFIMAVIQYPPKQPLGYLVLAVICAVPILSAWQIFRGKNWARWFVTILLVLDVVSKRARKASAMRRPNIQRRMARAVRFAGGPFGLACMSYR